MRRTAGEVIKSLEMRVARLERSAFDDRDNDIDDPKVAHSWRRLRFWSNLQNHPEGGKIEKIRDRMLKEFKDTVYIFRSKNDYPPFLAERHIDRIFFLMFRHLSRLVDLFEKYDRKLLIKDIYVSKGIGKEPINLSFSLSVGPDFIPFVRARGLARPVLFFKELLLEGERQVISHNMFEEGTSSSNPRLVDKRRTPKEFDEAFRLLMENGTKRVAGSMFSELSRLLSDCIEDVYNGRLSLKDLRRDPSLISLETAESWGMDHGDYDMSAVRKAITALYEKGLLEVDTGTINRNVGGYPLEMDGEESFLTPRALKYLV